MSSRVSTTCAAATAVLLAFAWTGEGGPAAAPPTAVHGSAEVVECKRGKQASDRRAVFRGEMTQITGATRMMMRIHLHEKVGSSPWRGAHAHGINLPREARPGVTRFAYRQRVLGLKKGSAYRVQIVFRWYSADGAEVAREEERSPVCRQPGKLANLKIRDAVNVAAGPTPDTSRYIVRIGNTGSVTAGSFDLVLAVDGAEVDTRRIGRLAAGQRREIGFVGPACRSSVVARIDPGDRVPEITESDNVVGTPCAELVPR